MAERAGGAEILIFFPKAAMELADTFAYMAILVVVTIAGFVENNQQRRSSR